MALETHETSGHPQRIIDLAPVIWKEDHLPEADQEDPMSILIFRVMVQIAVEEMIDLPETETTGEDAMTPEMSVLDMIAIETGIEA